VVEDLTKGRGVRYGLIRRDSAVWWKTRQKKTEDLFITTQKYPLDIPNYPHVNLPNQAGELMQSMMVMNVPWHIHRPAFKD
jgi:hypothetical protein